MTVVNSRIVPCPQCGRRVEWDQHNRYRPFCSERCKLIDLGEWANERYRIPDETMSDITEEEDPPGRA